MFWPQPTLKSSQPQLEAPESPSADSPLTTTPTAFPNRTNVLRELNTALQTMQDHYFSLWLGKWTTAIDWTGAVIGTYVSATLSSFSRSLDYSTFNKSRRLDVEAQMVDNEINKYFAHSVSYYFGEDHFAIRMQAFDDMLWVVLGWLEAANFVSLHSATHFSPDTRVGEEGETRGEWHATQFIPAFAHRARVFYELAEQGWDWRLCGGGMTWNPRLLPYKNAITNQLFIAASIGMYLHFPGDENCSPFLTQDDDCGENSPGRYDPMYLANAVNGYNWLKHSGMTNDQGLYVDGFHIGGYRQNHSKATCDERNEMVYTYNQGVVLSGLRGLWHATGNITYLEDGHELIRNVIKATGWIRTETSSAGSFTTQKPQMNRNTDEQTRVSPSDWHGLGSNGILTELCDPSGHCNQNGQAFKGIFFHHLSSFCMSLPTHSARPGRTYFASWEVATLHHRSCSEYAGWVVHNAQAALHTRDGEGRFGGWWGADFEQVHASPHPSKMRPWSRAQSELLPDGAVDYRNTPTDTDGTYSDTDYEEPSDLFVLDPTAKKVAKGDLNDRGRGRTIETQGSGVAVVRAMWEFLRLADGHVDDII